MKKLSIVLIIAALLFAPLPAITADANTQQITVATDVLNLRQGPGLAYPVLLSLKRGDKLQAIRQQGDWIEVNVNGKTGWVASWLTNAAAATASTTKKVIAQVNRLNLRSEPSLSASVLTQLSAGAEATFVKQQGDWVQVQYNNQLGWVSAAYISISEDKQAKPAEVAVIPNATTFTVDVDAVNIRQSPSLNAKRLGVATRGTSYKIVSRQNNWVEIQYTATETAWIYSFYGVFSNAEKATVSTSSNEAIILQDGTNIRAQASTSAAIVYRAKAGETFPIIETKNDWYTVRLADGKTGYVASWVVSSTKQQTTTAVVQADRKKGTLKGLTIVIDPGHGGNDNGTTGQRGTAEKDINLLTAELLKTKLRSAGANVILTRESDEYVALRSRVTISNNYAADAFISIHYDAIDDSSVNGFTTYYTTSTQKALANAIHSGLQSTVGLRDRGVQPGNYLVLRENQQPAVLLELGYLSNANEERQVTTAYYREQATLGIYKGLLQYFDAQLN